MQLDCDCKNPTIHPGLLDNDCDGVDEDCSGTADDGYVVTPTNCGVGECAASGQLECQSGVEVNTCVAGSPVPENTPNVGVCIDGLDNDCDGLIDQVLGIEDPECSSLDSDDDGDGLTENQGDCDDTDPQVFPGAPIICDGKDNNCDGYKDFLTDEDKDGDGVPWCAGDCDDNDPNRSPLIDERPFGDPSCSDGIDNDCDGYVDLADASCSGPEDLDGDGYCNPGHISCINGSATDCNDLDPNVNPGATEGPFGDPTCNDGIDNDCDELIDLDDPDYCAQPDVPHDTITDCTLCHNGDDYVAGATLDNAKCLACHDGLTATLVETHHTPGDLNCTDCHNVMRSQGANLSHVKTTLASFTANGAGSDFADYSGTKVCETCHTTTVYYNNNGTGAPHEIGVCTNCHTHDTGFMPIGDPPDPSHLFITDCTLCHDPGTYIPGATLDNAKCLACHDGLSATLVETHHTPGDLNCTDCHNVMRDQTPNIKAIKLTLAAFTANAAGSDFAPGTGAGICETCHTTTTYYNNTGTGAPHETWVCTTCHSHDIGFTLSCGGDPADVPHSGITNCEACHSGSCLSGDYVVNAQIPNSKCLACHDGLSATLVDTHFSSTYIDPSTGLLVDIQCVECHNPMRAQINLKHIRGIIRGIPVVFTAYSGPNSFADGVPPCDGICEVCHTQVAPNCQQPNLHNPGTDCTTCHTHQDGF
jgi:hypothetical protein